MSLSNLTTGADLILTAKIIEIGQETFLADVDRVIAGAFTDRRIEVRKFRDWTCGRRWAPYEIEQSVLLFLQRDGSATGPWRIMGGGGEGEMAIDGMEVAVRVWIDAPCRTVGDAYYAAAPRWVRLHALIVAMKDHRACFSAVKKKDAKCLWTIEPICNDERIKERMMRSEVHEYLFRETLASDRGFLERWWNWRREATRAAQSGDLAVAEEKFETLVAYLPFVHPHESHVDQILTEFLTVLRALGRDERAAGIAQQLDDVRRRMNASPAP